MTDEFSTFYKTRQSILCICPNCMAISRLSELYIVSEGRKEKTWLDVYEENVRKFHEKQGEFEQKESATFCEENTAKYTPAPAAQIPRFPVPVAQIPKFVAPCGASTLLFASCGPIPRFPMPCGGNIQVFRTLRGKYPTFSHPAGQILDSFDTGYPTPWGTNT